MLLLAGLVGYLAVRGGGEEEPPPTVDPGTRTPAPLDPVPNQLAPTVEGTRDGRTVTFTWRAADKRREQDSWQWTRTDTGAGERTTDTSLTLRAPARVCLQVRLIRGTDASPPTERCVD